MEENRKTERKGEKPEQNHERCSGAGSMTSDPFITKHATFIEEEET